jgi:hypothetical protein
MYTTFITITDQIVYLWLCLWEAIVATIISLRHLAFLFANVFTTACRLGFCGRLFSIVSILNPVFPEKDRHRRQALGPQSSWTPPTLRGLQGCPVHQCSVCVVVCAWHVCVFPNKTAIKIWNRCPFPFSTPLS